MWGQNNQLTYQPLFNLFSDKSEHKNHTLPNDFERAAPDQSSLIDRDLKIAELKRSDLDLGEKQRW